jgi:hypothetical protein
MMPEELTCPRCDGEVNPTTDNHVWDELEEDSRRFYIYHVDCLDNAEKPVEFQVCDVCGIVGKDGTGTFSGAFVQGKIQHPSHVDWDSIRKTLDSMMED